MIQQLLRNYHRQVKERIDKYNNLYSFGEDSIRYDFYHTTQNFFGLSPTDIILEQPIPPTQFISKERDLSTPRQGRNSDKPEFDLRIDPSNHIAFGILAEFAFFRHTEISSTQARTANIGKIMNEIHRLALLKHFRNENKNPVYNDFSNYSCILICITDFEMIEYGNGTRGRSAEPVLDSYKLTSDYLNDVPKTVKDCIQEKFSNKVKSLKIIPSANRIFNQTEKKTLNTPKWATWVWEIGYDTFD